MSNAAITFSSEAIGGGSGWFDFNPKSRLGWSFEETVARINGAAQGQPLFGAGDYKSVFNAYGFVSFNGSRGRFILCDWREDRRIHVMVGEQRPKGLTQAQFLVALQTELSKSIPKAFRTTYANSEDVCS